MGNRAERPDSEVKGASRDYQAAIRKLDLVIVNLQRQLAKVQKARLTLIGYLAVPDSKHCPTCPPDVGPQPASAFNRNRGKPDGLQTVCRKCQSGTFRRHIGKGVSLKDLQEMGVGARRRKPPTDIERRAREALDFDDQVGVEPDDYEDPAELDFGETTP